MATGGTDGPARHLTLAWSDPDAPPVARRRGGQPTDDDIDEALLDAEPFLPTGLHYVTRYGQHIRLDCETLRATIAELDVPERGVLTALVHYALTQLTGGL